jgi:hypothetical protein
MECPPRANASDAQKASYYKAEAERAHKEAHRARAETEKYQLAELRAKQAANKTSEQLICISKLKLVIPCRLQGMAACFS